MRAEQSGARRRELEGDDYGSNRDREVAANALHQLANTAGRNGALAGTAVYDDLIAQVRTSLPAGVIRVWDLLAAPSRCLVPDASAGRELARALAAAGVRRYPDFDPNARLGALQIPAILLYGREDTLVPLTETLRLAAALPSPARRRVTITRLLGHAKVQNAVVGNAPTAIAFETRHFIRAIHRLLSMLEDRNP